MELEKFLTILFSAGGVSGLLLGFHLWKLAPELRAIWRAIDRLNRVWIMTRIIQAKNVPAEAKEDARALVEEIDAEEARGKKREMLPP